MKTWIRNISFVPVMCGMLLIISCTRPADNANHSNSKQSGNITISGAFALYPLTVRWAEEYAKINPGVRIDISAGGAGKGMADALAGMCDLGMFSRGISPAEKARGVWWVAVSKDAVLPTIQAGNPFAGQLILKGISPASFSGIFVEGTIKNWTQLPGISGRAEVIHLYTRSDACGAAQMWAEFLGTSQENLPGIGIYGDPGMADAVRNDKLGLGYNNLVYIYDISTRKKYPGLEVVPVDLNANGRIDPEENYYDTLDGLMAAIGDGRYPSPPARELYFVAAGEPANRVVTGFLRWILTDGQQFVSEAGYVRLSDQLIREQLKKLNHE